MSLDQEKTPKHPRKTLKKPESPGKGISKIRSVVTAAILCITGLAGCTPATTSKAHSVSEKAFDSTPAIPSNEASLEEAKTRMIMANNKGKYVDLEKFVIPGYKTLVVFTTPWCSPCKTLKKATPDILKNGKNLRIVYIDAAWDEDSDEDSEVISRITKPLGLPRGFPVAVLYNQEGVKEQLLNAVDERAVKIAFGIIKP